MRVLKFFPIALAALTFAACSSDDNVAEENETLENGGSVAVKISLPTTTATRTTPTELNDGKKSEYAVDNATLVLFDKDSNVVTKRIFANDELQGWTMDADDNITTTKTVEVPDKSAKPKFVLALINLPSSVQANLNSASNFAQFNKLVKEDANAMTGTYHFMSNSTFDNEYAPAKVYTDGRKGLQNLQVIDPASVSKSKDKAAAAATNIFVERATVKVDVTMTLSQQNTQNGTTGTGTLSTMAWDGATGLPTVTYPTGDKLVVTGWTLNVLNRSFYPVKNISPASLADWNDASKYWMAKTLVGGRTYQVWRGDADYRSYWGVDGNYGTPDVAAAQNSMQPDLFKYASYADANGKAIKDADGTRCEYCLENTFDVAHQVQNLTTAVLITGKYILKGKTAPEDFYTIYGTVYSKEDILTHLADVLNDGGYVKYDGTTTTKFTGADFACVTKDLYIYKNIIKYVGGVNVYKKGDLSTVLISKSDAGNDNMNKVIEAVLGTRHLAYYKGGMLFYSVPIRHFDDSEVPLYSDAAHMTYSDFNGAASQGINTPDKLGRYGVLRNNWYTVNITAFVGLGRPVPHDPNNPDNPNPPTPINPDPTDPDPNDPTPTPPTPDDVESYYVNATINILPWAKRLQDVDL